MFLDANGQPILDTIHHCDALDLLRALPDGCIHMALIDMPYQTTALEWDTLPDLPALWTELRRVTVPKAALVFTASQPFTSQLVMSNLKEFRHEWIWHKSNIGQFLDAKFKPLKVHESILIFGKERPNYYPQMTRGKPYKTKRDGHVSHFFDKKMQRVNQYSNGDYYPKTVQYFESERGLHPTQKPLVLFEYLIRTYSLPGEVILDCFCGSGTTAHAAYRLDRHYICGDSDAGYVAVARKRLADANVMQDKVVSETHTQLSLFG